MWWFTMGWCFAAGYAAATFHAAARCVPLNRADTVIVVGIATVNTIGALVFIFGHDEGPALVCAAIIALVGTAYSEQERRAYAAATAAVRRPRGQRRYH